MSKIRVWKLGSLEYKIFPSPETIDKFMSLLPKEEGVTNIVWGPDVQLIETYTDLHLCTVEDTKTNENN